VAIKVHVRKNSQIITPIRFGRVGTGFPTAEEPDVDDRGFSMGRRPFAWGTTDTRGAVIGITAGQNVRIKILREDLDPTAPLFVTVTPPDLVQVVAPALGRPLVGFDEFEIRGVKDEAFRAAKIQVRLGSDKGSVLGELECHIFTRKTLRVVPHFVTIRGVAPSLGLPGAQFSTLLDSLVNAFDEVNAFYRPVGIEFNLQVGRVRQHAVDRVSGAFNAARPLFKKAGKVTMHGSEFTEFSTVVNLDPARDAINVYFVRFMTIALGATFSNRTSRAEGGFGMVVRDTSRVFGLSKVLAHELCHYLDIPQHPDQGGVEGDTLVLGDMWTLRRLMKANIGMPQNPPHHADVGYGPRVSGVFITLKDFSQDDRDSECARMRVHARHCNDLPEKG
jgi:hypothetical protein